MPACDYFTGLDLGQVGDPSAAATVQRVEPAGGGRPVYEVRYLFRWPLKTSYSRVIADACVLVARDPLPGSSLVMDRSGVGMAVWDALSSARPDAALWGVTITGGTEVRREGAAFWVPKVDLVACVRMLLEARRLRVASGLTLAPALVKELQDFRVKVTKAANEVYAAREGQHDDLLLSVAIAVWLAERFGGGGPFIHLPPPHLRTLLGLSEQW